MSGSSSPFLSPEQNHRRPRRVRQRKQFSEVRVARDKHGPATVCGLEHFGVERLAQSRITNVLGRMAGLRKKQGERRRLILVEQKPHADSNGN